MVSLQPAAALVQSAARPFGGRALVSLAAAAPRARSRVGASASGAARAQGAPLGARGDGVGPSPGESDRRHASATMGALVSVDGSRRLCGENPDLRRAARFLRCLAAPAINNGHDSQLA